MTTIFRSAAIAWLVGCLVAAMPAAADWNSSAMAPFAARSGAAEVLRLAPDASATQVTLDPMDDAEIETVTKANAASFTKRLQIGIGRDVPRVAGASAGSLQWVASATGRAAQWKVTSSGARALRIALEVGAIAEGTEVRFAGLARPDVVYGPFAAANLRSQGSTYWSPVLEGDTAIVEVFVPWESAVADLALGVAQVSHLIASPSDPAVESILKASGSCEVDLVCRSASDAALASVGKAVAKMTFSDGQGGGTYLCTGTLLNAIGASFTPYFYSANHCMSTQAAASTLTTHWFYDRTGCGGGSTSPSYVQLAGGATLLYANAFYDALLLRLNGTPPAGAVFAGWDSSAVATGTAFTAVHHPAGDLKKVSLASMGGFGAPSGSGSNFMISDWLSIATGVTEGGSSGSGIFTAIGSPASDYRLRGGLFGGPSSCTASSDSLYDYYSRLDQVYPAIAQYLNPGTVACSYTLSASTITLGASSASGTFTVTASSGCSWTATSDASWLTTSSSGNGTGTVTYSVAANPGSARTGTITVGGHPFTVVQQAPTASATNLLSNPNFETGTAVWSQSATGGYAIIYQDSAVAHAGQWYAWLGGYDSGVDTMYQDVTIPSDASQASLRFWYWIGTSETTTSVAYDTMTVAVHDPATGARIATIATYSNLDRTSGWVQSPPYDLTAFRGRTVRLEFTAKMDGSNITNFFLDDISVTATGGGAAPNYTALWWIPAESGWGINFNHQGDIVFGTLFTYDAAGNPMWLVMSTGARQSGDTFSGPLYRTTGPAFNANPFTPIGPGNVTAVGTMTVAFSGDTATLDYTVNGTAVHKAIQKQVYGSRAASCTSATSDRGSLSNYQDLWWNPAESGWGVNVTHQDQTLFATLFTYAPSGQGLWLVMSAGTRQSDGSYSGTLYQTTGPAFNAVPFTPLGPGNVRSVGTMRFSFSSGTTGTLSYDVDGVSVTKSITRQVFSSPLPACAS